MTAAGRLARRCLVPVALSILACAGCATRPQTHYVWGSYEEVLYGGFVAPDKFPPTTQIASLERDAQVAAAANRPLPPGWHAELGMLYADTGRADDARDQFAAEKASFPESATLMDRLVGNMNPAGAFNSKGPPASPTLTVPPPRATP